MLALVLAGCGSSKKNESSAADTLKPDEGNHNLGIAVQVDGKLNEWPEPLPGYSRETAMHFGVTNDNDFLYIAVACSDERMQRKLLAMGMQVYISESGKKETVTGIAFPLPAVKTYLPPAPDDDVATAAQKTKDFKSKQLADQNQVRIFGFKKTADGTYTLHENNFTVAYSQGSNNFFNIEYAIPVKEIFSNTVNSQSLQVGFKLNGYSGKDSKSQGGSYAGGAGRGGMRGGGMRGGGMRNEYGSQGGYMSELNKDQSFWTKYVITKSKQ